MPKDCQKSGKSVGVPIAPWEFGNTEGRKIGFLQSEHNSISVGYAHF